MNGGGHTTELTRDIRNGALVIDEKEVETLKTGKQISPWCLD
jgi:hypothetical protein